MATLDEIVKKLPPRLQEQVAEFAGYLLERRSGDHLCLDWAGALRGCYPGRSSVELQHLASHWRVADALEETESRRPNPPGA